MLNLLGKLFKEGTLMDFLFWILYLAFYNATHCFVCRILIVNEIRWKESRRHFQLSVSQVAPEKDPWPKACKPCVTDNLASPPVPSAPCLFLLSDSTFYCSHYNVYAVWRIRMFDADVVLDLKQL